MTKVHVDDLISRHIVDYSKLATYWFVVKLCPTFNHITYLMSHVICLNNTRRQSYKLSSNGL